MKTVIIHGQSHQGSTCHLARSLAEKLGGEVAEFFLPRDFGEFCAGCTACFTGSEKGCPHYEGLAPITRAIDEAGVLILASPVYVYHATGAMKAFLDHYGWRWMVHRPEERMFTKQAVCISTAAGAGMGSTNRDMAHSTFWWGVARTYRIGMAVRETSWERVDERKRRRAEKKLDRLAKRLRAGQGRVKPGIKTRAVFWAMAMAQRKGWNPADAEYWKEKGWTKGKHPWRA